MYSKHSMPDSEGWRVAGKPKIRSGKGKYIPRADRAPNVDISYDRDSDIGRKRQRRSTGGTSGPSTPLDFSTGQLMSLEQFKMMGSDDKLDTIFSSLLTINSAQSQLNHINKSVMSNTLKLHKTLDRVKVLEYRSIDQEARSRRLNLLFRGIPEYIGENCVTVLQTFIVDKLKLTDDICIQRAHRIGRKQYNIGRRGFNASQRPIIVAFRDNKDIDLILSKCKELANTPYGVSRDYPNEIVQARKSLYPQLKELRKKHPNSRINIVYPARLVHDKETIADLFPDWASVMRRSRHVTSTNQEGYSSDDASSDGECSRSVGSVSSVEMRDDDETVLKDLVSPAAASNLPMSQSASNLPPSQPLPSTFTVDNLLQDKPPDKRGQNSQSSYRQEVTVEIQPITPPHEKHVAAHEAANTHPSDVNK